MSDREKTVKGLEIHADRSDKTDCDDCPYIRYKSDCIGQLCSDALELLKEQKTRIERLEHELAVTQDNLNYFLSGNA